MHGSSLLPPAVAGWIRLRRWPSSDSTEAAAAHGRAPHPHHPKLCVEQGPYDRPDGPQRRFPGHWPNPGGAEALPLAVAEAGPLAATSRQRRSFLRYYYKLKDPPVYTVTVTASTQRMAAHHLYYVAASVGRLCWPAQPRSSSRRTKGVNFVTEPSSDPRVSAASVCQGKAGGLTSLTHRRCLFSYPRFLQTALPSLPES